MELKRSLNFMPTDDAAVLIVPYGIETKDNE